MNVEIKWWKDMDKDTVSTNKLSTVRSPVRLLISFPHHSSPSPLACTWQYQYWTAGFSCPKCPYPPGVSSISLIMSLLQVGQQISHKLWFRRGEVWYIGMKEGVLENQRRERWKGWAEIYWSIAGITLNVRWSLHYQPKYWESKRVKVSALYWFTPSFHPFSIPA